MARRLWLAPFISLVALSGTPRCTPGDGAPPAVRVLFPAGRSVLEAGRLEFICVAAGDARRPPTLRIDGKAGRWELYVLPVLVARLDLKPGRHAIAVGATKLEVYVQENGAQPELAEWPLFRTHPGGAEGWKECQACHEVTEEGGRQSLGALREPAACQQCHSAEDFQLAHFHPEKPLAGCHQCHALHGSTAESLLKGPRKQLCAECHD